MKGRPLLAAIASAAIGLSVGFAMIPDQNEQLAMLSRDGRAEAALDRAEELFEAGNREPALVLQAFVLNEQAGRYDRALAAFHAYFKERPNDIAAWRKAAAVFEGQGQTDFLNLSLESLVRLSRDQVAAERLAAHYRLNGRLEDELRVLQAVESMDLSSAGALRLAMLLLGRGQVSEGAAILEKLDNADAKLGDVGRIQLFAALTEQGKYEAAADRAIKWQMESKSSPLGEVFIGYLLSDRADKAALRLASSTIAVPGSFARLARQLSDQGRFDLLEQLLGDWLTAAQQVPADQIDAYLFEIVTNAGAKGLTVPLFERFFRTLEKGGDPGMEASFLHAMSRQFGYAGIAPFRSSMRPVMFHKRPVFAAQLLFAESNALEARRFLFSVRLQELPASSQFEWLEAAKQILSPGELVQELTRRARAKDIPSAIQKAALDSVLLSGSQPQTVVVWHAFFGDVRTR